MKVEQHIPASFSGFNRAKEEFNTIDELLNIDWIKKFAERDDFYRFSLARDKNSNSDKPQHVLMVEYKKGLEWWVIAYIRDKDISGIKDLPEWEAKYEK